MKIGLISLGCPKNLVDSEVMLGLAQEAGHELTPRRGGGGRPRREHLRLHRSREAGVDRHHPRDGRAEEGGACRRLVVTGCLAERYRDELQEADPRDRRGARHRRGARTSSAALSGAAAPVTAAGVSPLVFHRPLRSNSHRPLGARHRAADLHLRRRHPARARDAASLRLREDRRGLRLQVRLLHHSDAARAVPQPSGRVDRHAKRGGLRARGVNELLLISQDTTFYGIDRERARRARPPAARAERGRGPRVDPAALPVPDDHRRRRCSTRWRSATRSCKYIDLPLQHASDRVLKRMRRPGTRAGYERLLGRIRERVPGVTLRTTFIVGFPGRDRSGLR